MHLPPTFPPPVEIPSVLHVPSQGTLCPSVFFDLHTLVPSM